MIIRIKTFSEKKNNKPTLSNTKDGKEYTDWKDFLSEHFSDEVEKEKKKRTRVRVVRENPSTNTNTSTPKSNNSNKSNTSTKKNQNSAETKSTNTNTNIDTNREVNSRNSNTDNTKSTIKSKPDIVDRAISKTKSIIKNPKFKKGAKIAGLATLGTAATAGLIAGGIKLKRKIDEKKSNEKMKKSILEEQTNK